jgi:hypothetical protein
VKRREFITLLGGVAAAWPLAAWAQQPTKILRVGTVAGTPKSSPPWVVFEQRMGELGYQEGKNFSFELRAQMSTKPDAGPGPPPSPLLHHVGGRGAGPAANTNAWPCAAGGPPRPGGNAA